MPVIDYDRLTLGGDREYYVSFNNVEVGKLIGQGITECLADWNVKSPQILVMRGAPTDNNATLFAQGYDSVLDPSFKSGKFTKVGEPAGTWDPAVARTTFEEQYTAHSNINAVVMPNDDTANAVVSYLKTLKVPPKTFPTTGQDATLTGLQNVLAGYQCGTVYKPIYLEAQAAAALALYLRAGAKPPAALVNGATIELRAEEGRRFRAADPALGHAEEHGRDGGQGRVRRRGEIVRGRFGGRLQVRGRRYVTAAETGDG